MAERQRKATEKGGEDRWAEKSKGSKMNKRDEQEGRRIRCVNEW